MEIYHLYSVSVVIIAHGNHVTNDNDLALCVTDDEPAFVKYGCASVVA